MEIIETAREADVPQLVELLSLLFAQEADFLPCAERQEAGLRLILAAPEIGTLLVARDGPRLLGMVSLLTTVSTAEGGKVAWLEDLIVRPECRGSGLGSRLLQAAITMARTQGLGRLTLLTDRDNLGAQRFYARQGFSSSAMLPMRLRLS